MIDAVSRGGEDRGILVCGKHALRLSKDTGEDIVADIRRDHRDISASRRVCLRAHARTTATLLRDQPRVYKKGKRLPDGLAVEFIQASPATCVAQALAIDPRAEVSA